MCGNPREGLSCILKCYVEHQSKEVIFMQNNRTVAKKETETETLINRGNQSRISVGIIVDTHVFTLSINALNASLDSGMWRCIADGKSSPTKEMKVYGKDTSQELLFINWQQI